MRVQGRMGATYVSFTASKVQNQRFQSANEKKQTLQAQTISNYHSLRLNTFNQISINVMIFTGKLCEIYIGEP